MILSTILEQAGHQGLPKIEPFGTLAWENLKKSSRTWGKLCIQRGSAQNTQNMQPACRKSCVWGYRESSIFDGNRWEFQSGSCFSQNSAKIGRLDPKPWNAVVQPDPRPQNAVSGDRKPRGKRCSNIIIDIYIYTRNQGPPKAGHNIGNGWNVARQYLDIFMVRARELVTQHGKCNLLRLKTIVRGSAKHTKTCRTKLMITWCKYNDELMWETVIGKSWKNRRALKTKDEGARINRQGRPSAARPTNVFCLSNDILFYIRPANGARQDILAC